MIPERSYKFIAQKVAKMNGDIRVAFDMMKSALTLFSKEIRDDPNVRENKQLELTYQTIMKVDEIKYGSKIATTIKSLTRQHIMILSSLSDLFVQVGEDRMVSFKHAFDAVEQECKSRHQAKM
jgi:Cdc6-like AAA superfamily ATPase